MQVQKKIFIQQVSTILTGNGIAQLLSISSAPLLTRLYGPESFGLLALFLALVSGVSPGVSGRYEMAIVVAQQEQDRKSFLFISLWVAAAASFFLLFLIGLLELLAVKISFVSDLGGWIFAFPLALFLTGAIAAMRAYGNGVSDYKILGLSAIVQSALNAFLAITLGYIFFSNDGQLLANIISLLFTVIFLCFTYRTLFLKSNWQFDAKKFRLMQRYKDFPLFNAPASIVNSIMTGMPVFFLASYFNSEIVGYYALLIRVGVAPLGFISEAVSRVNLKKISELINAFQNPIPYIRRLTLILFVLAAVPGILLAMFAPTLFSWFFGDEWGEAGALLVILIPALMIQFVVSTLSLSFIAAGHHRLQALWQYLSLITTLLVFSMAVEKGVHNFFLAYMIKDVVLYLIYYLMLIYAVRNPKFVCN